MSHDLVIRGGTIVTASETYSADIGITGESIAADGGLRLHSPIDSYGAIEDARRRKPGPRPGDGRGHDHDRDEATT